MVKAVLCGLGYVSWQQIELLLLASIIITYHYQRRAQAGIEGFTSQNYMGMLYLHNDIFLTDVIG